MIMELLVKGSLMNGLNGLVALIKRENPAQAAQSTDHLDTEGKFHIES